jgi:Mn-dependent DtxR family transcriptional regulator
MKFELPSEIGQEILIFLRREKRPIYLRKIADMTSHNPSSVLFAVEILKDLDYVEGVNDDNFPQNVRLYTLTEKGKMIADAIFGMKEMISKNVKHNFTGMLAI